jgi:hypothetical protein
MIYLGKQPLFPCLIPLLLLLLLPMLISVLNPKVTRSVGTSIYDSVKWVFMLGECYRGQIDSLFRISSYFCFFTCWILFWTRNGCFWIWLTWELIWANFRSWDVSLCIWFICLFIWLTSSVCFCAICSCFWRCWMSRYSLSVWFACFWSCFEGL